MSGERGGVGGERRGGYGGVKVTSVLKKSIM